MPKIPSMDEMLLAGCHFGHQASHWHPHMEPFIYTTRNGVHIIDLKKTQTQLLKAAEFISKVVAEGGDVLFVGTKVQAQPLIAAAAKSCNMPFVNTRWVGGTLTNYHAFKHAIERYLQLVRQRETGEWEKYTKKERAELTKEEERLKILVSGLTGMRGLPKAMFVVDVRTEQTAVKEANVVKMPVVALCDTNVNPRGIQQVIPCNDDASRGIELMLGVMAESVNEGLKNRKVVPQAAPRTATPAPVRKPAAKREAPAAPATPTAPVTETPKPAAETKDEAKPKKAPAKRATTRKPKASEKAAA